MVKYQGYGHKFYYDSNEFIPRLKRKLDDSVRETWLGYSDETIEVAKKNIQDALTDTEYSIISLRFGLEDGYCRSRPEVTAYCGKSENGIRYFEKRVAMKLRPHLEKLAEILRLPSNLTAA